MRALLATVVAAATAFAAFIVAVAGSAGESPPEHVATAHDGGRSELAPRATRGTARERLPVSGADDGSDVPGAEHRSRGEAPGVEPPVPADRPEALAPGAAVQQGDDDTSPAQGPEQSAAPTSPAGEATPTPSPTAPSKRPAPAQPAPTQPPAPPSGGSDAPPVREVPAGVRDAALHPFATTSVWNVPIGSGARFESADAARTRSFLSGQPVVNRASWSISVVRATGDDPTSSLRADRNGHTFRIRIPADAVATGGSDRHVTIVQPDGRTAYDVYKLEKVGDREWRAAYVVVVDLQGEGIGEGVRAAGVPAAAGLIRKEELAAVRIPHALAVAVPGSALRRGPVWPATREDSDAATSYKGALPMGSLVAIPGSVDLEKLGLSREGWALAKALQDHGAYVVDRSDTVALYCELDCDPTQTTRLAEAWRVLHSHMRVVTNSGPDSVGGGGTPRASLAPRVG